MIARFVAGWLRLVLFWWCAGSALSFCLVPDAGSSGDPKIVTCCLLLGAEAPEEFDGSSGQCLGNGQRVVGQPRKCGADKRWTKIEYKVINKGCRKDTI